MAESILFDILTNALKGASKDEQLRNPRRELRGNLITSMASLVPREFKDTKEFQENSVSFCILESFTFSTDDKYLLSIMELAQSLLGLSICSPGSLNGKTAEQRIFSHGARDVPGKLLKLEEKFEKMIRVHDQLFGEADGEDCAGQRIYRIFDENNKISTDTAFTISDFQFRLIGAKPYFSLNLDNGMITFRYLTPGSSFGHHVVNDRGILEARLFDLLGKKE